MRIAVSGGRRVMTLRTITLTLAGTALLMPAAGRAQIPPERPPVTRQPTARPMPAGEVPGNFSARFTGPRAVRLSWNAAAGATGYNVFRAPSAAGPWTQLATAGAAATAYDDATAAPSAKYAYRVTARYADRMPATTAAADVAMPCDRYCVNADCNPVPRPVTKLTVEEGTSGAGAQFRFTLKVTAVDAATGAALPGTVTVSDVTRPIGTRFLYRPCRAGSVDNLDAEIVACRARVNIPGRGETRIVTAR